MTTGRFFIEALTGDPGGECDAEGKFPEGSISYLVDQRLGQFAEAVKQSGQPGPAAQSEK